MKGEDLKALVDAEWKRFPKPAVDPKRGPVWSSRTTPPFPVVWPSDGRLDFYAFADGFRPGLMDGVCIAAPWLRVRVADNAAPVVTVLSKGLVDVGIQGVRPVNASELETLKKGPSLPEALRRADVAALKDYYAAWTAFNGVIAGELRKLCPDFFRALSM